MKRFSWTFTVVVAQTLVDQGVGNDIDFDALGDPTAATYQYVEVVLSGSMLELQVVETVDFP